jgi:Sugar (and other) transporter
MVPDTSRWLAKHGHKEQARETIARLLDKPENDIFVEAQLNENLANIDAECSGEEPFWTRVFTNGTKARNLQRVLLGMGPYMTNQWSGINALCCVSTTPVL